MFGQEAQALSIEIQVIRTMSIFLANAFLKYFVRKNWQGLKMIIVIKNDI